MTTDQKEHKIISHLRKDARKSMALISQEANIPVSTIHDKIHRMHKDKVIKRFTTIIDFSKLGYHHRSKIALKVPFTQKEALLTFLRENLSINSLYEINGGFDFMIEAIFKNIKEQIEFVQKLRNDFDITNFQEFQIVNDIDRERFLFEQPSQ